MTSWVKADLTNRIITEHFLPNVADLEPYFLKIFAPIEDRIARILPIYLALQSILMVKDNVKLVQHETASMMKFGM